MRFLIQKGLYKEYNLEKILPDIIKINALKEFKLSTK